MLHSSEYSLVQSGQLIINKSSTTNAREWRKRADDLYLQVTCNLSRPNESLTANSMAKSWTICTLS